MKPVMFSAFRWIPVAEGLPDHDQEVAYVCIFQGHTMTDTKRAYNPDDFRPGNEDRITHWFPLPERP